MKTKVIFIITGLSGSGKSTALDALEDAGFYCIDNMPVELLPKFLEMPLEPDSDIAAGNGFARKRLSCQIQYRFQRDQKKGLFFRNPVS